MKINCFFDGACCPVNPGGAMGMGAVIYYGYEQFTLSNFKCQAIGNTNNVAEYLAFKWILETLIEEKLNDETIEIFGDSNLVVQQMNDEWRIKHGRYKNVALQCKELLQYFPYLTIKWIPREQNDFADTLSTIKIKELGLFKDFS